VLWLSIERIPSIDSCTTRRVAIGTPPRVTSSCSNLTRKQSSVAQSQHLTMRRQQAPSRRQSDDINSNDNHSGTSLSLLNTPTSPRNLSRDDDYLLQEQSMKRTTRQSFNEHYLTGWRIGALLSLIGAVLVFVFNLVITIWVWRTQRTRSRAPLGQCIMETVPKSEA
jgi:hypothetical protein